MLLNLTNHPFRRWPTEQQRTALQRWGTVKDLPFPEVPPESTTRQVALLARETVLRAAQLEPDAVLCQGEMTLTLVLTALLQRRGIPVYAAVSRRQSREHRQGQAVVKTSEYCFHGFREYPRWPWPSQSEPPHEQQ